MKRKAIISKSDADWSTFKSLRNRVNSTLQNDKEIFYRNLINKNQDPKDAWKAINGILGRKQLKPIMNNLKLENEDIVGPEEVSECFNNHFTRVGAKIADSVESGGSSFTEYLTNVSSDCSFNFNCVDPQTVFDMLHSISTSKATGIDQIPGKILKLAAPAITQSIIMLFNYSIATESFPSDLNGKLQKLFLCINRGQEIYLITTVQFQSCMPAIRIFSK